MALFAFGAGAGLPAIAVARESQAIRVRSPAGTDGRSLPVRARYQMDVTMSAIVTGLTGPCPIPSPPDALGIPK